jgi:hypothetical protein
MIRADVLREFGWGTSITEDFQLTLRLYEKGYKVVYTPYIQAPAECVSTLKRLIRQRMRWAEGHTHNVRRMFTRLMHSPHMSLAEKLEFLYLTPYYLQSLFFLIGTLSWLIAETVFRAKLPFWTESWGWALVFTNMFSLLLMNAIGLFIEESDSRDYKGLTSFLLLTYVVVPFQAYAAIKGLLEREEGHWFRTPKTGIVTIEIMRGHFARLFSWLLPRRAGERVRQAQRRAAGEYRLGRSVLPSGATLGNRFALATASNRFSSFGIKRKKRGWFSKGILAVLLAFSVSIFNLSHGVPETFATSDIFYFRSDTTDSYGNSITALYSAGGGEDIEALMDVAGPSTSTLEMDSGRDFWWYSDPVDTLTVSADTWTLTMDNVYWNGSGPPSQQYVDWAFTFGYCDNDDASGSSCSSAADYHQLGSSGTIRYTGGGTQSHDVSGSAVSSNPCSESDPCRLYVDIYFVGQNHGNTTYTFDYNGSGDSRIDPPATLTVPENAVILAASVPAISLAIIWLKKRKKVRTVPVKSK